MSRPSSACRHLQLNDISNILAGFNVHRKTYFCTKISGVRMVYDTMVNNRNSDAMAVR